MGKMIELFLRRYPDGESAERELGRLRLVDVLGKLPVVRDTEAARDVSKRVEEARLARKIYGSLRRRR